MFRKMRRPRMGWGTFILIMVVIAALLAAVSAPESGDMTDMISTWWQDLVEKYKAYWPSLSKDWEDKLRESKQNAEQQAPPPDAPDAANP